MNYRHAYHAGNFADVVKHIVLCRIVQYLTRKPQPFRVIDTHAGAGFYDLCSDEAAKTNEWRDGVGRLYETTLSEQSEAILAPYRQVLEQFGCIAQGGPRLYPGSPLFAAGLMRAGDVLIANELHDEDAGTLRKNLNQRIPRHGPNFKVMQRDAWQAMKALLPPPERRGLVVIDPPFEKADEFSALTQAIDVARRRFSNGVYLIWYPLKSAPAADAMVAAVTGRGIGTHAQVPIEEEFGKPKQSIDFLDLRISVAAPFAGLGLTAAGVLVLNPPYLLEGEMTALLPDLMALLADDPGAGYTIHSPSGSVPEPAKMR